MQGIMAFTVRPLTEDGFHLNSTEAVSPYVLPNSAVISPPSTDYTALINMLNEQAAAENAAVGSSSTTYSTQPSLDLITGAETSNSRPAAPISKGKGRAGSQDPAALTLLLYVRYVCL
ncbi:hypothetical protein Moror_3257 [Moniliophthora roreri MCA 2997]|uniref:Uncharacterized protein n=1 Tax=Moniliophthora roreri (strain MCA 2997) TaxID=1381753 RepID=V2WM92_MONRO|nr:hypothetical protein Moror_3257 [Moniliophthora roreri MCA 2997]